MTKHLVPEPIEDGIDEEIEEEEIVQEGHTGVENPDEKDEG